MKIGRNQKCPCGSGKKYKKCHLEPKNKPIPNPGQFDSKIKRKSPKKECLSPNSTHTECSKKIIRSHSVSRSSLKIISKNNHVYSNSYKLQTLDETNGSSMLKLVGINESSTFDGFCSNHDKKIFAPIEDQKFTGHPKQCFLISYRAICWELNRKTFFETKKTFLRTVVSPLGPNMTKPIDDIIEYEKLNLSDMRILKEKYDSHLMKRSWGSCQSLLIEFKSPLPIQCSGTWGPSHDINGIEIQKITKERKPPSYATISSFASGETGYFLLTWLKENSEVIEKLSQSIEKDISETTSKLISSLILLTTENVHISPDWYENVSEKDRTHIKNFILSTGRNIKSLSKNLEIPLVPVIAVRRI